MLTSKRVTNSVGELAASMDVKRCVSMRWSTKQEAVRKGQPVDRERAWSEGVAVGGRAARIDKGAE